MMGNRPEYVAIWLGLTRVGIVVALLSPDLRGAALRHALGVARAQDILAAEECAPALREAGIAEPVWTFGAGAERLDLSIELFSTAPLTEADAPDVSLDDRALRIFTSGTTGMPKAAEVSHRKVITWTHWFAGLAGLSPDDRLYNCLPMHHSVGGVVAIGAPLVVGGSVGDCEKILRAPVLERRRRGLIARRFNISASSVVIWSPRRSRTMSVAHKLRLALGNGLSAPVWRAFADRFPDIRVLEFYASTEGNVWLYNVEGRVGALGRLPPYLAAKAPIALVRFDEEAQAPLRGPDGFCTACEDDEPGEALGRIAGDAASRFEGYSEHAETEKKILRDVFAPGDAWMRTGDLMRRDSDGFYHFVDRIGDTFRWKGENVAIAEVDGGVAVLSRRRRRAGLRGRGPRHTRGARGWRRWRANNRSICRRSRAGWKACRDGRGPCSCGLRRRSSAPKHSSRSARSTRRKVSIPAGAKTRCSCSATAAIGRSTLELFAQIREGSWP